MNRVRVQRLLALIVVLFVCVSCDQATKSIAQNQLSSTEPVVLLNGLVRLQYMENPGAFLSLGAGLPKAAQFWIFTAMVPLILAGLVFLVVKEARHVNTPMLIAIALLLGGGIGNLIDRLVNDGRVIDFVTIGYGYLHTGVFNVADMCIMAGVILLALSSLQPAKPKTT